MSAPLSSSLNDHTGGSAAPADAVSSHTAAAAASYTATAAVAAAPASGDTPRLRPSPLAAACSVPPGAALRSSTSSAGLPCPPTLHATTPDPRQLCSPITPATAAPAPAGPSAQECVSVLVRLKGITTKLGSTPLLLDYAVEDGSLATPRTARRVASLGAGTDVAPAGSVDATAATAAAFSSPTAPRSLAPVSGAVSHSSCPLSPLTVAPSPRPTFASASDPPATPAAAVATVGRGAAGGMVGSRGRVLTIVPPNSEERRQYEFGEVLEPDTTNLALCERLVPSVMEQMAAGYNVCVLCYGQTGSGKTYTMNALAPAVADEVFRGLDANNEVVEMSYIQIYNNKAYNLLDGGRATGRFGVELSRPLTCTPISSTNGSSSNSGSGNSGRASEPKVLLHSAAEMQTRMRGAARLRVTHAHALNGRISRSFTLLSLHITRFLDGAPLTTTRVTLADLAGTERLKKSGATGEAADQAIFINKSLMALRQLVEASGTEAEVLHFRESLLTTYLAPRMRSWHLVLLVTVSLEVSSYEETKSSLDFATNARRRRVRKVRSRTADSLIGAAPRGQTRSSFLVSAGAGSGLGSHRPSDCSTGSGDSAELQAVVDALQHRVHVLEEALRVEQQRSALAERASASSLSDELAPATHHDGISIGAVTRYAAPASDPAASPPSTAAAAAGAGSDPLEALRREAFFYRQLLHEREEDLRRLQSHLPPAAATSAPSSSLTAPPLSPPEPDDTRDATAADTSSASGRSLAGSSDDELEGADGDDTFVLLRRHVRALRTQWKALAAGGDDAEALDQLRDAVLRATELYDDARERLLVTSISLAGLRAQNHQLCDRLLDANRQLLAQDARHGEHRAALQAAATRAAAAEAGVGELRLRLYQAYAEQAIREETTRLYLDATHSSAADADETVSSRQHPEHQAELEKVQAQHQALCDKITELVDSVDQLTRAVAQRDVSLAALESLITPAQRAQFQSMSSTGATSPSTGTAATAAAAAAAAHTNGGGSGSLASCLTDAAEDSGSAADCLSLLQSRVSELAAMLTQEQQHHHLTQRELAEAREDARRSRQEQRQATLQQQEEARRVAQLTAENFELRQQNERHQLYLDQLVVSVQEQLLQLRHQHEAELAAVRVSAADGRPSARHTRRPTGAPAATLRVDPPPHLDHDDDREYGDDEEDDDTTVSLTARASGRRNTTQGVPPAVGWPRGGTARGATSSVAAADAAGVCDGSARGQQWSGQAHRRSPRPPRGSTAGLEEVGTVRSSRRSGHTASALPKRKSLSSKRKPPLSATYGDRRSGVEAGLARPDTLDQLAATSPSCEARRRGKSTGSAAARGVKRRQHRTS